MQNDQIAAQRSTIDPSIDDATIMTGPAVVTAIPANNPNHTLKVIFWPQAQKSPNSPLAKGLIELDGVLSGVSVQVSIFKGRDGGTQVGKIGGKFPILEGNCRVAIDKETGDFIPQYDYSVVGNEKLKTLSEKIHAAYNRYLETGDPRQTITLQVAARGKNMEAPSSSVLAARAEALAAVSE
jgi:hypothetical protein